MKVTSIAIILFCTVPLAHATTSFLITNGTFETGTLAGWTATTGAPFMDVTGSCNDGFAAQSAGTGCATGASPAFGTYAAYSSTSFPAIANNVGEWDNYLTQNFVVPAAPINSATLSFEYEAAWGGTGSFRGVNVEANILDGSSDIGQVALVINPSSSGSVPWTLSTTDFTSLLSTYAGDTLTLQLVSIAFYDSPGGGSEATTLNTGFDNVQITVISGVPEPGAFWLASSGFLLVLASQFSRRRA